MVAVLESQPRIRPMRESDLAAVLEVEQESYLYPWSRRIFEDCLRVGYCCLVAESEDGYLLGHGLMMARAQEAHVLNICVDPTARRRGVAWALLHSLVEVAHDAGTETAFLEVRASNHGAIALYESANFQRVGHRRDYYPAPFGREDAIVMARQLRMPRMSD